MSATTGRNPLYNSVAQNAVDMSPIVSVIGEDKTLHISIRTDGKTGSGHLLDPYDGSSAAKVDSICNNLPTNASLHFIGPGPFLTKGYQDDPVTQGGFQVKSGQRYFGDGREITQLRLMALRGTGTLTDGAVFAPYAGTTDTTGTAIEDMLIDCNANALSAGTAGGIDYKVNTVNLIGSNCAIRRVHSIHNYGKASTSKECFPLGIVAHGANATNALIEGCIVDTPATGSDYGQAIGMSGQGGYSLIGGRITGCEVKDWIATSAIEFYIQGGSVDNNTFNNVSTVFYGDTGSMSNITIADNQAFGVTVQFANFTPTSTFTHQRIDLCDNFSTFIDGGIFLETRYAGSGTLRGLRLKGNRTGQFSGTYHYPYYLGGGLDGIDIYDDNRWGSGARFDPTVYTTYSHARIQ